MQNLEFAVLDFIQNNMANDFWDFIMPKITALGNAGILWIILTLVFLISKKYRPVGLVMLIALIIDLILCNIILKPAVARIRPYDINTAFKLLIPAQPDYSFPSGHSAASFAAVTAMYLTGCRFWKPAAVIAFAIAFSRLYLYVHFPTDVIAGILLGILSGIAGYKIYKKYSDSNSRKTV